ncbi:BCCT family transporter [Nocardioides sp.]|uniref:BCCT family transporter n=1 Tax=Nocardioides sp. TaxID=35761 RepID=UPI0019A33604|nr:BCCT family transporter [Nocardioides sp.]MBC7277254.1 BCCT family transporter [Nocardioides sp.]
MSEPTLSTQEPDSEPAKHVPPTGKFIPKPGVFVPSAALLILFVVITAIFPTKMGEWIGKANSTVVGDLGWWYIALVTGFVAFSIWAAIGRTGDVVLGKEGDEPEFRLGSWFAMLFAAGMGIGLVFWGVAEPLNHFNSPPPGTNPDTAAGHARTAMDITFLHWGLSAWAIYVVVGLGVAYAVHRRGLPVSIRWALEPVLGKYAHGFIGDVVDVIAVLGTVFGVATSLGLGVSQLGAGLDFLGWVNDPSKWVLILLVIVITACALVSVVTGVDKGIKWLSNINMVLAVVLVVFVLIAGPTVFILTDFFTQIGSYLRNFLSLTFDGRPYEGEAGQAWLSGWTTYYWGWWMSWAPFVGVFIARISKGRTVREFVAGVLLVPTLVTFLWFSVMGGTAIYREMYQGGGIIGEDGVDTNTALFQMLDGLPWPAITSVVAMILLVIFFVTSSDSASFVVDMLSSGGNPNPPKWSRAMWASMEGAIAAVLLFVGLTLQETDPDANPLGALQTMAILLALPFSIVMVMMVVSITKSLLAEARSAEVESRKWLAERVAKHINDNDMVDKS